ncbi:hypothetical protein [Methylobacterium gnaphalii]|nr:hypothetical protein [Methylobacterium gnaphalii]
MSHDRGRRKSYALAPSGRAVETASAEAAIASPYMVPRADGLFGSDTPQSWSAR